MTENEKRFYIQGRRSVTLSLLGECLRELGYDDPGTQGITWIIEREQAIAALRSLCEEFGDNDWPDDLILSDVIEKNLARHLY